MVRRRTHRSHWTDSLPDDGWTHAPKAHLYRLQHPYKPRYLGTYLAELFSDVDVMTDWGEGDYFLRSSIEAVSSTAASSALRAIRSWDSGNQAMEWVRITVGPSLPSWHRLVEE